MFTMENQLLKIASEQGIWVLLAVFLLVYTLKKQEKRDLVQTERENNYQKIIQELSQDLGVLNKIDNNLNNIEEKIDNIKDSLKGTK